MRRALMLPAAALALAAPGAAQAAAGDLDAAFTTRAMTALDVPEDGDVVATATYPDGRVVTVADRDAPVGGTVDIVVRRLLADGSPDASFGVGGAAIIDSGKDDDPYAVAVQADGRIVVAGANGPANAKDVTVFRLRADGADAGPNGALDRTFNDDGRAVVSSGGVEWPAAVAVDATGRIVIVATSSQPPVRTDDVVVYRLRATGGGSGTNEALDPSFDGDGAANVHVAHDVARGLVLRPDDRIVVVGDAAAGTEVRPFVARLLPDGGAGGANGALDPAFDGDGVAELRLQEMSRAAAVALDAGGRILVAGDAAISSPILNDGVVWRLLPDGGGGALNGALDPSFADAGVAHLEPGWIERPVGLAVDAAGRTIVGAEGSGYRGKHPVALRLRADGSPDPAYGSGGVRRLERDIAEIQAFAMDADGRVVLGGSYERAGSETPALFRMTSDPAASPPPVAAPPPAAPPVAPTTAPRSARRVSAARFAAKTKVTARVSVRRGRLRVRLANANGFAVRVRVTPRGRRATSVTVRARASRTVVLRGRRAGLRVTATDPAGATRRVRVELRQLPHDRSQGRS